MCSSHRPAEGADSEDPRPYRVTIVDRDDPHAKPRAIDLKAYGINDVRRQVEDMHPGSLILGIAL